MKLTKIATLWPPFEDSDEIAPDVPGIEFTAPRHQLHFTVSQSRLHFTARTNPLHFEREEN